MAAVSPTNHQLPQIGQSFFGRRYGRPSLMARANSTLLFHHSSRSREARQAFTLQPGEQNRRELRLPSGRAVAH